MFILIKTVILLKYWGNLLHALEKTTLSNCVGLFHLSDAMNDAMNGAMNGPMNHCKRFLG